MCLRTLYYGHYHSRLSYGINIWFPFLTELEKDKLIKLQKRVVRILEKESPLAHCMPLFKRLSILMVKDLVKVENVKSLFRVDNELAPRLLMYLYTKSAHQYGTQVSRFVVPKHNTSKFNATFLVKGISDWDSVDISLRNDVRNLKQFTRKLKQRILSSY